MAHILLAEDDDQLREFLTRGLKRAGHSVDPFPDGAASRGASACASATSVAHGFPVVRRRHRGPHAAVSAPDYQDYSRE